jgi:F-type H+-transporting ATPase subunit gamma
VASLKDIKNRIQSVKSTQKITSAMKMVASAKLHKAQASIDGMLPYKNGLEDILYTALAAMPRHDDDDGGTMPEESANAGDDVFRLCRPRSVRNVAVVAFSSNNSLCGAFNSNMNKSLAKVMDEYAADSGVENVFVYAVGKKVADFAQKAGYSPQGDFTMMADKPNYADVEKLVGKLADDFLEGKIDRVEFIYYHFLSTASQKLTRETLIPFTIDNDPDRKVDDIREFIVEPSLDVLLSELIPKVIKLKLFTALLDNSASEHGARLVAMQTATDNADDLLQQLNIEYNKTRQQSITNELLDIVGGSLA